GRSPGVRVAREAGARRTTGERPQRHRRARSARARSDLPEVVAQRRRLWDRAFCPRTRYRTCRAKSDGPPLAFRGRQYSGEKYRASDGLLAEETRCVPLAKLFAA